MKNEFPSVSEFLKTYKSPKKTQKEKKLFTSIESGKYNGKKLLLPNLSITRSTKSIVKACVFNVIRQDLRDKIFIEVFGGSALMALEALSNFALKAYAIELDFKAYKTALQNAKIDENLEVINADSFEFLPKLLKNLNQELILYLDPPFDIRQGFDEIYEKVYKLLLNLKLEFVKIIIIEHNSKANMPTNIQNFIKTKVKKFGSTSLSFYEIEITNLKEFK